MDFAWFSVKNRRFCIFLQLNGVARLLLIYRLPDWVGAIRITDCIVPDWFPDSIYWPESSYRNSRIAVDR